MTWSSASKARNYFRDVVRPEQHRRHAAGKCITLRCDGQPEMNQATGKPKWRCPDCSTVASKAQQQYKRRHSRKKWKRKKPVFMSEASRLRQNDASAKSMRERYNRLKAGGWCVICGVVAVKKAVAKRAARLQRPCIGIDCKNTCKKRQ